VGQILGQSAKTEVRRVLIPIVPLLRAYAPVVFVGKVKLVLAKFSQMCLESLEGPGQLL
jgi:hypothetical protein